MSKRRPAKACLSVMSFNIDGRQSVRGEQHQWASRVQSVLGTLKTYRTDVIVCQEAQSGNLDELQPVLSEYELYRGLATVEREPSSFATYNPIVWRSRKLERLEAGAFYLSKTPGGWSKDWDSMSVRGATWVLLQSPATGREFVVVNTHLDHVGRQARRESSKLIIDYVDRLCQQRGCPVILMGDFNSRAWAPPNECPTDYTAPVIPEALPPGGEVHAIYMERGFKDSYREAGFDDKLDMNTYHDYYGPRFPPAALRIDWILYRTRGCDLTLRGYRTIRDEQEGRFPSDHYPITAEFTLHE